MDEDTYEESEDVAVVTTMMPYDGWSAALKKRDEKSPNSSSQVTHIDVTFVAIVEMRVRNPLSSTPNALAQLEHKMDAMFGDPNFMTPIRPINKQHASQKTVYKYPTPPDHVDLYSFMTSMLTPPDVTPNRRLSFRNCSDTVGCSARSGGSTPRRSDASVKSPIDDLEESLFELADKVEDYITEASSSAGTSRQPDARRLELDRRLNALAKKFQGWDDDEASAVSPALARLKEANDTLEQMNLSVATPASSSSRASSHTRPEHIVVQHPDMEEDDDVRPGNRQRGRNFNTSYDRADDIQVMASTPGLEEYTVRRKLFKPMPTGEMQEERVDVEKGDEDFKKSLKRMRVIWKKWAPKGLWDRYQKRRQFRQSISAINIPEGASTPERQWLEMQERTRKFNLVENASPHTKAKLMKIPYYRNESPGYKQWKDYKQSSAGFMNAITEN